MTKYDREKLIAEAICFAQSCSDAGKRVYTDSATKRLRYKGKLPAILRAIALIKNMKPDTKNTFNYYVTEPTGDQNGRPSIIVYFDLKINGQRMQVSFHTPMHKAGALMELANSGRKTRWRKVINSRSTCDFLRAYYGIDEWE